MIDIDAFNGLAQAHNGRRVFKLSADGLGVTTRSGRMGRWAARFKSADNRAVSRVFAESLVTRYGDEASKVALQQNSFDQRLTSGKRLRIRHVRDMVAAAESIGTRARELQEYCGIWKCDDGRMAPADAAAARRVELLERATRRHPDDPGFFRLVDPAGITESAKAKLNTAQLNRARIEGLEKAAEIVSGCIDQELDRAWDASERALTRFGAGKQDSFFDRALNDVPRQYPALQFDSSRLTDDAVNSINERLRLAIRNQSVPLQQLDDDHVLRRLAHEVAVEFVAQRWNACKEFESLQVEDDVRAAMTQHVIHDTFPETLAMPMGRAFLVVQDDLVRLVRSLDTNEVRDIGTGIANEIDKAVARANSPEGFRDLGAFRLLEDVDWSLWRFPNGVRHEDIVDKCWRFLHAARNARAYIHSPEPVDRAASIVRSGREEENALQEQRVALQEHVVLAEVHEDAVPGQQAGEVERGLGSVAGSGESGDNSVTGNGARSYQWPVDIGAATADARTPVRSPAPVDHAGSITSFHREEENALQAHEVVVEAHEDVEQELKITAGMHEDAVREQEVAAGMHENTVQEQGDSLEARQAEAEKSLQARQAQVEMRAQAVSRKEEAVQARQAEVEMRAQDVSGKEEAAAARQAEVQARQAGLQKEKDDLEFRIAQVQKREAQLARDQSVLREFQRHADDRLAAVELREAAAKKAERDQVQQSQFLRQQQADLMKHQADVKRRSEHVRQQQANLQGERDQLGESAAIVLDQQKELNGREQAMADGERSLQEQRENLHHEQEALQQREIDLNGRELGLRLEQESKQQVQLAYDDARQLVSRELAAGRDPRSVLRNTLAELAARHGARDGRTRAYAEICDSLDAFFNVVNTSSAVEFDASRLLAAWKEQLAGVQARCESMRPRTQAERQRAETYAEVDVVMQKAIKELSFNRDPRPGLRSRAEQLEAQWFVDGGTGAAEAAILRSMVQEYDKHL